LVKIPITFLSISPENAVRQVEQRLFLQSTQTILTENLAGVVLITEES